MRKDHVEAGMVGGAGCLVWAWRRGVGVCVVLVLGSFVLFLASSSPSPPSSVTLSSPVSGKAVYSSVVQPLRALPQHLFDVIAPRRPKNVEHSPPRSKENKIASKQGRQGGTRSTQRPHVKEGKKPVVRKELARGFLVHSEVCSIPDFDPFHHTVTKYISRPSTMNCKKTPALTTAIGTTLVYHRELLVDTLKAYLRQHPDMVEADFHGHNNDSCCYRSIHRVSQSPFSYDGAADGRWRYSPKCIKIEYGNSGERKPVSVSVDEEGLLVLCYVGNIVIYKNVHMFIQRHKLKEDRTNPEQYVGLVEDIVTIAENKSQGETLVDVNGGGSRVVLTLEENSTTNYSNCDKGTNNTREKCRGELNNPGTKCDIKDSVGNGSQCGNSSKGYHSSSDDVSNATSHSSRNISDASVEVRVNGGGRRRGEGGGDGERVTREGQKETFHNKTINHIANHSKHNTTKSSEGNGVLKHRKRNLLSVIAKEKRTTSRFRKPSMTRDSLVISETSLGKVNYSEKYSELVSAGASSVENSKEQKKLRSATGMSASLVPKSVRVPEGSLEVERSNNETKTLQESNNTTKTTQGPNKETNQTRGTSNETRSTQESNVKTNKTRGPYNHTTKTTRESNRETKTTRGSNTDTKTTQGSNNETKSTQNSGDNLIRSKGNPTLHKKNGHANHTDRVTPSRKMKPKIPRAPGEFEPLSVVLFGTDSVSRLNLLRHMPMTHRYLTERLGALDFAGFNKVADNTFPNMLATLSGFSEEELKNHSCMPKGDNVEKFDDCPFVWRDFEQEGYVTAYIEDAPWMGMFHYMHNGFVVPPTHYYGRPFFLASEKEIGTLKIGNANTCQGNQMSLQVVHDYSVSVARTFPDLPYFGLYWSASLTHDYINMAKHADGPHLHYLNQLDDIGAFNNTVMVFLSDHGMRFGDIRSTYVGMLEERLPYVFIVLPPWFKHRYPAAYTNLHTNTHRLTSNYDLHATLRDLVSAQYANATHVSTRPDPTKTRGISLFQAIPEKRRCEEAGIPEHFCTCQETFEASVKDPTVVQAADHIKHTLNTDLTTYIACAQFTNYTILTARVSAYKKNLRPKDKTSEDKSFVLQLRLSPGGGEVEATLRYNPRPKVFTLTSKISRINAYGSQSHCISDFELRKFCFCKDLLGGS